MSRNDELNSRAEMIEDALQEGYAKGLDEGLAEGVIKGREEGRADAAKRMIASGMPREQVADILQLSNKELDSLLAS
jgi:predicted transposase/invertase (TIGR01784 family)